MKKNSKRGFILAETIAVSMVVITALIVIYSQFITINNSYYRSFKYNSVDKLYAIDNINQFLKTEGIVELAHYLKDDYLDISSCSYEYFVEYPYCEKLFDVLNVKQIIFTENNIGSLRSGIKLDNNLSQGMKDFINTLNYKESKQYRILVEFNDDTYATLLVN